MISLDFNRKLFEKELQVLETARAEIAAGKHDHNELIHHYIDIVENYEKLLTFTRKVFKISDAQGKNLIKRESEIKNLLNNAGQGFLTFGKDLIVDREYSGECVRIFGKKIGKMNILTLLTTDDQSQNDIFAVVLRDIWQTGDEADQRAYLSKLPGIISINEFFITLEFKLIPSDEGGGPVVMLILTDVTEKFKAQEQVTYLSYHDKLTSLYNRAYIDEWISVLKPVDHFPLSIIMADMNALKLTNDVFGHAQGDQMLVELARVISSCCRSKDIVSRWGGDEFLIMLPGTDADNCAKVCQRIKAACAQERDLPIELSAALGMATQQNPEGSIADLFNVAENRMYSNKLQESKQVRRKIILGLEKILHNKCFEGSDHVKRIEYLTLCFARRLGIPADSTEVKQLILLAKLHDIGKVAIPGDILCKPGPLTDGEWEIVRSHSEIGYRMAQSIGEPAVGEAILAHHERWDGLGYPSGLKEIQINLVARIFSIVDAYDVMGQDRPYRKALSQEEALREIKKGGGTQFDPELVNVFVDCIMP